MQAIRSDSADVSAGLPSTSNEAANDEFFEAVAPPQHQAVAHVDRFEKLELPPFWSKQVQLWFAAIEAQFQLRRLTSDLTKYQAVVARLDQETLIVVEHVILNPPETDKYLTIKEVLVNHFSISQERRLKKLLSGVELGDRRPSELLAEIKRLGGSQLDATFARTIWFDRLPQYVQVALTTSGKLDNDKLAVLANKIVEIQRDSENRFLMPIVNTSDSSMQRELDDLSKQLGNLAKKLNQIIPNDEPARRQLPRNTAPTYSGTERSAPSSVCYYHRRFGTQANKCTRPCTWVQNQGNSSSPQ
ncbi:PREDICTED: uncharacterized protein LOC108373877 [Rhagoletis zephyria]|uniref:uncharacterized protein LOC108373877 n=1 Tax=Rhagoletis zephyria TaxID=28612 RepID=UPI0008114A32|nr:PREDICTED: uncharacterized protein LOC108373877 [Rhagoletis zephyria]